MSTIKETLNHIKKTKYKYIILYINDIIIQDPNELANVCNYYFIDYLIKYTFFFSLIKHIFPLKMKNKINLEN